MLGVIKRAVILGLAATARGQQANQNCKVTKDVCLELAPKPTSCTTNELAIGCKELFAHCGPVCNLHLSESIECQLYGDVKKDNGNTIYSLSKKINFITSSALEKLIKSPSKEEMLSIIDQTTTTLDRLKVMIKSSKSIKDAHQSSDHPLTTHDYLAPDDHLEKYYGKGGILESELFDQINDLKEKFTSLINKEPEEIKEIAKDALRGYSNEVIRKSYQPKTETSTTVYEEEIHLDTDPNNPQFFGDDFNYDLEDLQEAGVFTREDVLRLIEDKTKLNIKKQPNTEL